MKTLRLTLLSLILLISCDATNEDINAQAEAKNNEAKTFLAAGNYTEAQSAYQAIIELGESDLKETATIGVQYCQMKFGGNGAAVNTNLRAALQTYPANQDAKALLALINYTLGTNENTSPYTDAFNYANDVITTNDSFVLTFSSSVDNKDIRLVMAQSKFRLGKTVEAFNIVIKIAGQSEPGFDTNSTDFVEKLSALLAKLSKDFG